MAGRVVELRVGAPEPQVGDRLAWDGLGWVPEVNIARPRGVTHVHTDTIVRVVMGPWRSPDFVSGSAGWQIDADGSAEFNNVTVRGTIYAEVGEIGGWAITATEIKSGTAIVLDSSVPKMEIGAGGYIRSSNYVSGFDGFHIDEDFAEFGNVQVRGSLHCAVFVKDLISAHAGTLLVTKSAGKLDADATVPAGLVQGDPCANITIEDPPTGGALFDVDDIVCVKEEYAGGVHETWLKIAGSAGGTNQYATTYQSGDLNVTYHCGTSVPDYGASGDGGILQTADMANAPWLSVFTHAGAPWTTLTHHLRLGNLNGVGDYSSDKYGIFIGDYSGNKWMSYDPTNSLRIRGDAIIEGTVAATTFTNDIGALLFSQADGLLLLGPNCEINDGEWWSLRRQKATITGAFHQEAGRWLGTRALMIEGGTTNHVTNPSFEVDFTGWRTAGTPNNVLSSNHFIFGDYAARLSGGNMTGRIIDDLSPSVGGTWTVSFWAYNPYQTTKASIYYDGTYHDISVPGNKQWTRYTETFSFTTTGANAVQVHLYNNTTGVWYDGVQVEVLGYPTTYCDGDQGHEYTWSGAAHNSTSARVATGVTIPISSGVLEIASGSVVLWIHIDGEPDIYRNFFSHADGSDHNRYSFYYDLFYNKYYFRTADNAGSATMIGTRATLGTGWHQIICTWNVASTTTQLFIDGELDASSSSANLPSVLQSTLYIGTWKGTQWCDAGIGEIATFGKDLSAAEGAAMYALQRPLVDAGAMDRPGIYILDGRFRMASSLTGNRIEIDADEIAGYSSGGTKQFYLRASDGKAMCGGGAVILDADGIRMVGTGLVDDPRRVLFQDDTSGARTLGWVGAGWAGGGSDPDVMWVVATRDSGDPWPATAQVNIAAVDTVVGTDVRIVVNSNKTVEVYGEDIFKTEKLLRPGTGTADPTAKLEDGCLFYRTDTDKLRLRANGAWVNLN